MKKYSSKLLQQLLTNEVFNFWKPDWSERIIIDWPKNVNSKKFFPEVRKLIGEGFHYERSLNGTVEYKATSKGLIKV